MAEEKKNITYAYIGNALRSAAADGVTTFADEVFDTERQEYQQDINSMVAKETKSPEFIYYFIDADERLLWWINTDGSVDWAKGVPLPVQEELKKLELLINDNLTGDEQLKERVDANEAAIVAINEALDRKVDGIYGESLEYIKTETDSEDRVLNGIRTDGTNYMPLAAVDKLSLEGMEVDNESVLVNYHTESPEFIRYICDSDGRLIVWVNQDGSIDWSYGVPQPIQDELSRIEKSMSEGDKSLREAIDEINTYLQETLGYVNSPEFIRIEKDAEDRIINAVTPKGVNYMPKVDVEELSLDGDVIDNDAVKSQVYTESPEFISYTIDGNDRVLEGLKSDGTKYANNIETNDVETKTISVDEVTLSGDAIDNDAVKSSHYEDNPEFINIEEDAEGRILGYTKPDGSHYIHNVESETIPTEFLSVDDIEDRLEYTTDSEDKIISYRDLDGVLHEEVGVITKNVVSEQINTEHVVLSDNAATELSEALKSIGFRVDTPTDWSEKTYIFFPKQPSCAILNISNVTSMPTTKIQNLKMIVEVWDMNGNYFKKKALGNAQGDSSMAHPKKNFALDFCEDDWVGDDTTDIKIGNWVTQDSFHFKAFATSITKAECPIGYKIFDEFLKTKSFEKRAPYMEYFASDYDTNNSPSNDLAQNMECQARCYPDGFPCIVYLNGEFYGIFSWQLKKHRDNMHMDRNTVDHIHLDGYLAESNMWNGIINWSLVEIRNPKPKSSKWKLLCQDGTVYNGDSPKEIMGTDSEFYDSGNKSCVNSAKTKEILVASTNYMSEIKVFEDTYNSEKTEENLSALKSEIEKRFSVEWMIDYILLMNILQDSDSIKKNIQWATWGKVNGTTKWFPLPYDLDTAFGILSTTAFGFVAPSASAIGKNASSPVRYVWDYYFSNMCERYAILRNKGAISYNTIIEMILKWQRAIGIDFYDSEYKKWPESPCNRDSNINSSWSYSGKSFVTYGSSLSTWKTTTTYSNGSMTSLYGRCYMSLQDNNVNHKPDESPEWWEDVYVKPGTYNAGDYIWDGKSNFYRFKALEEVVIDDSLNNRPFSKFYTAYPFEGGVHDSIYRISKWISRKIEITDNQFNYNQ